MRHFKTDERQTNLSKIKKGEYFKFIGGKKENIYQGGGPKKGFNYIDAYDINAYHSTRTDRKITINY